MDLNKSPFKRLREATGLNGAEFTRQAAIARTSTVYLDAGLILMPRAVDELFKLLREHEIPFSTILDEEYDSPDLETATILWQKAVRQSHSFRIQEAYAIWLDDDLGTTDPFTQFAGRAFDNTDQFCKAMKVQTGPIKLWLESATRPIPPSLSEALYDAGLQPKEVGTIEREVKEWRKLNHVGSEAGSSGA